MGRNENNFRYADDTTLMKESKEKLKSLFEGERGEWKSSKLRLSIQKKKKIMISGPITSWQIYGERMETVTDFILGGSRITAVRDCSHEIKRHFLLGRKTMTNLDSILKSRHYFANKGQSSQGYGFSSSHGCESWAIKKAEHWRTDAFELSCWRTFLRVPWTTGRSNQSIQKEIEDWC